jgi:phosphatidylglycerophosphate synthase
MIPLPATGLIFLLIAIGDIIDGWVARVLNRTSVIGEYMDKETDALLVLLGTMIFYMQHIFGIWVIFLGLIRYAYFLVMYFFIPSSQKERKDPSAKFIAVLVISSILLTFFIPILFSKPLLICSGILLTYSFGRSVFLETGVIK